MSLILGLSILIYLIAIGWSIVFIRQLNDWRMGFLTVMLGLMGLRQVVVLRNIHQFWPVSITWQATEIIGLIVSIMTLLVVFFVKRMLTERKQVEDSLHKIYDIPTALILVVNKDHTIVHVSSGWEALFGYDKKELAGKSITEFLHPDDVEMTLSKADQANSGVAILNFENRYRRKDGSYRTLSWFSSVDKATGLRFGCAQDITERKQIDKELSYQASHDALTGLVNRREFERRTERLLSTMERDKGKHVILFMDLDEFKLVNDTCGHSAGDELLRQLASLLGSSLRQHDTLARLGGDEFGVLMESCFLNDALRVAKSLQKTVTNYRFTWEGNTFNIGVSIGLVPITEKSLAMEKILKDADAACYMAKRKGRNRIQVFQDEDSASGAETVH